MFLSVPQHSISPASKTLIKTNHCIGALLPNFRREGYRIALPSINTASGVLDTVLIVGVSLGSSGVIPSGEFDSAKLRRNALLLRSLARPCLATFWHNGHGDNQSRSAERKISQHPTKH